MEFLARKWFGTDYGFINEENEAIHTKYGVNFNVIYIIDVLKQVIESKSVSNNFPRFFPIITPNSCSQTCICEDKFCTISHMKLFHLHCLYLSPLFTRALIFDACLQSTKIMHVTNSKREGMNGHTGLESILDKNRFKYIYY